MSGRALVLPMHAAPLTWGSPRACGSSAARGMAYSYYLTRDAVSALDCAQWRADYRPNAGLARQAYCAQMAGAALAVKRPAPGIGIGRPMVFSIAS